ncbi:unnamed protein product [Linum trigynum]|uniref:Uncharacterized protein n=1 Tax=Linum trigynum TaxID=586398 RepID=A0AAV2FAV3_9ROSI
MGKKETALPSSSRPKKPVGSLHATFTNHSPLCRQAHTQPPAHRMPVFKSHALELEEAEIEKNETNAMSFGRRSQMRKYFYAWDG